MGSTEFAKLIVLIVGLVLIAVLLSGLSGCATWTSCTDPYADYPGCGDREG